MRIGSTATPMKQRPSSARPFAATGSADSASDSLYSKLKDDILKRAKENALSSSASAPNRSPRALSSQFTHSVNSPDRAAPSFPATPTRVSASTSSIRPSSASHSFTSITKASPPPRPPTGANDVSPRPPFARPPSSHVRLSCNDRWRCEAIETVSEPTKPLSTSTRTSRCAIMNLMVRLVSKCHFGNAIVELKHSGLIELQTPPNRSKALQYILGKHDDCFVMCCPEHHLLVARILWTNGDFDGSKNWYKSLQTSQAPVGETNAVETLSRIVDDTLSSSSLQKNDSDIRPLLLRPHLASLTSIDAVIDVFSKVPPFGSFLLVRKALTLISFGRLEDALQAVKTALRHAPQYCEALILDDLLRVAVDETRDLFTLPLECVALRCSDGSHFVCKSWDSTRLSIITSIRRAQALRFESQVDVLQQCVEFLKAEQSGGLVDFLPQPLVRQITFRCLAMRATILRKMGDHGGATEAIGALITDRPDDKQLHKSFLQCLMDEKRSSEAFRWLTEDPRALALFSKEEIETLKVETAAAFAHSVAPQSSSSSALNYHFSKCDSNPFLVLGLFDGTNTTRTQLKKAYRAACLQWHPDKWSSHSLADKAVSHFCFQMVSRAYEAAQKLVAT